MIRKLANDNMENVAGGDGWEIGPNGQWRYIDEDGNLVTNAWKIGHDNNWYYLGQYGTPVTGWRCIEGKEYYFDKGGKMAMGWTPIDGTWYYFDEENGTFKEKNTWEPDRRGFRPYRGLKGIRWTKKP